MEWTQVQFLSRYHNHLRLSLDGFVNIYDVTLLIAIPAIPNIPNIPNIPDIPVIPDIPEFLSFFPDIR